MQNFLQNDIKIYQLKKFKSKLRNFLYIKNFSKHADLIKV